MTNKNKKLVISIAAGVLILAAMGGGYYYYTLQKFKSNTSTGKSQNTSISSKSGSTSASSSGASTTSQKPATYQISGINKSDGSVFTIPDTISFTISPNVDSSRVRLVFQDGSTIYDQSVAQSTVNLTAYPNKKLAEGDTGTIIIDGIKDGKVVVTKEVKVVF